jgi:hypothetical protein
MLRRRRRGRGVGVGAVHIGMRWEQERERGRADWVPRAGVELRWVRVEIRRGGAGGLRRKACVSSSQRDEVGCKNKWQSGIEMPKTLTHIVALADGAHPVEAAPLELDAPE